VRRVSPRSFWQVTSSARGIPHCVRDAPCDECKRRVRELEDRCEARGIPWKCIVAWQMPPTPSTHHGAKAVYTRRMSATSPAHPGLKYTLFHILWAAYCVGYLSSQPTTHLSSGYHATDRRGGFLGLGLDQTNIHLPRLLLRRCSMGSPITVSIEGLLLFEFCGAFRCRSLLGFSHSFWGWMACLSQVLRPGHGEKCIPSSFARSSVS
jgi:hypothetical protein